MYVCGYACNVCMYDCMHVINVCVRVCMYACAHAMYVCCVRYVCTHVHQTVGQLGVMVASDVVHMLAINDAIFVQLFRGWNKVCKKV